MILFEKKWPATLDALETKSRNIEVWSFDDAPTRRASEVAFAAVGITARCRSAYKPLVCAFLEEIATEGLHRAEITYPRHPDAKANRFLLESYPLTALFPDVEFTFTEGQESDALPSYQLRLTYGERVVECHVLAPNRSHEDYAKRISLSPCGWLIEDGKGSALQTSYEQLYHETMQAIEAGPWDKEPYFQELNISVTLPVADEELSHGDEVLSLREALHEEFYFSLLEVFQVRSGRPIGDRHLQPGQIVPEIRFGKETSVVVELRPYDANSSSSYVQELAAAEKPLSQEQISTELARIEGKAFVAKSVSGREIKGIYHAGTDRGVIISAGQHANETTSPVGTLRAAQRLSGNDAAHFTICPLENPDGYALHQRLIVDNPRHMHHAARYTALGDDLEYREGKKLFETAIRREAESQLNAMLHLNFHGYPAHEWTRPLSGYIPRGFEMWTLPKGFFLVMRYQVGWDKAARALMDDVTRKLDDVHGLRAFNDAQIALFERHAGETGFENLNGFPVMISEDTRHRVPMSLITEYPDETIYGDAFRAGHEAQMATVLAAYDALQALPDTLFPDVAS